MLQNERIFLYYTADFNILDILMINIQLYT